MENTSTECVEVEVVEIIKLSGNQIRIDNQTIDTVWEINIKTIYIDFGQNGIMTMHYLWRGKLLKGIDHNFDIDEASLCQFISEDKTYSGMIVFKDSPNMDDEFWGSGPLNGWERVTKVNCN